MATYISDWAIYKNGIGSEVRAAFECGDCKESDVVWRGPSGDAVIASDPAELGEEYADYSDAGQVAEYLA